MAKLGKKSLKPIGLPVKLLEDTQLPKFKFAKANGCPMTESGFDETWIDLDDIVPYYQHAV
jgi:hypothetical protein